MALHKYILTLITAGYLLTYLLAANQ